MSEEHKRNQVKKSLTNFISSIARTFTTSQSLIKDTPHLLLELKERLKDEPLRSLEDVYVYMWRSDIVHVLIEVLREDFSTVDGQWKTASDLASLLAKTCTFLKPNRDPKRNPTSGNASGLSLDSFTDEDLEEYYDILLPTAIDSLLILANHIYENAESNNIFDTATSSALGLVNLEHFKVIVSSLNWICSVHSQFIHRTINSPYLLHLLVTDYKSYAMLVLSSLHELISQQESQTAITEELQSLLDELVFKIGGSDEDLALSSLSLLALLCGSNGEILVLVCDKYKGMSVLLEKWRHSFDGFLKSFAQTLLKSVKVSEDEDRQSKAAVVIQSGWKGYCARKKMLRAKRGIIKFQRLYRRRKAAKNMKKASLIDASSINIQESVKKIRSTRELLEREKQMLEEMPASSMVQYVMKRERCAAIKIQSWWKRRKRAREEQEQRNTTGQQGFKTNDGTLPYHMDTAPPSLLKEVGGVHEDSIRDNEELIDVENESVADLLKWFYSSRSEAREADRKHTTLMAQLSRQCELLLSMPRLSDSTVNTYKSFMSLKPEVQAMARRAHQEELASQDQPWWKVLREPQEELEL